MVPPLLTILLSVLGALVVSALLFFAYTVPTKKRDAATKRRTSEQSLRRVDHNPILSRTYHWEQDGVMNPGVVHTDDTTHLFYRAVGADGVSRIGYASSKDGTTIDTRLPYPIFALEENQAWMSRAFATKTGLVSSGGSFAGVEDPRAVVIDDRLYLSFAAFRGWDSLRIGVSSLLVDDLKQKRWKWTPPVYLSAPHEVHKNWVLFPEKIEGKFAVLHGLHTDHAKAHVALLDTLTTDPKEYIRSDASFRATIKKEVWDSRVRGIGPPPLKTPQGWLALYHANDAREPHKYKIGAYLLDLLNPSHILARTDVPLLEPDMPYENHGKPGVVYACGATLIGDTVRVYYGGGDTSVCTAYAPLSHIFNRLVPLRSATL